MLHAAVDLLLLKPHASPPICPLGLKRSGAGLESRGLVFSWVSKEYAILPVEACYTSCWAGSRKPAPVLTVSAARPDSILLLLRFAAHSALSLPPSVAFPRRASPCRWKRPARGSFFGRPRKLKTLPLFSTQLPPRITVIPTAFRILSHDLANALIAVTQFLAILSCGFWPGERSAVALLSRLSIRHSPHQKGALVTDAPCVFLAH